MHRPGNRVTVAETLSRDLKVSEWCDLLEMKIIGNKTKTMIVSRSRTMHPVTLTNYWRNCAEAADGLLILGVILDSKMTFEKLLRSVCRAASHRLGILRKSWQDAMIDFWGFVLPVLEHCSTVWCSVTDTPKTTGPCCQWCQFLNWGCV